MYDLVFITPLPAFYKINLYRELGLKKRVCVIYLGRSSNQRTPDFTSTSENFKEVFLSNGSFEERNRFFSSLKLFYFLLTHSYQKVIVGGWDQLEYWLTIFLSKKSKNTLVLESSSNESTSVGIKGRLKRIFIGKLSLVYVPGKTHNALLKSLGFSGKVKVTHGVGIINKPTFSRSQKPYAKKFLYLGRLSPEKNLFALFNAFAELPDFQLTVIGNGPLKESLIRIKPTNVVMRAHVENRDLPSVFAENNFLILASLSETWGLVVEEALYFGCPVIISESCGASELVTSNHGYCFDPHSSENLLQILRLIKDADYQKLASSISPGFIAQKDLAQLAAYLD